MTLREAQEIFFFNWCKLIAHMFEQGYTATAGELWRPPEMCELYAKRGIGTKNSLHGKRLAGDVNLFKDGRYYRDTAAHEPFGNWWEALSIYNRWGGRWQDGNHYEMQLFPRK